MKLKTYFVGFLLALGLTACGKPIPQDKLDYVGRWEAQQMYVSLTADGTLDYKRKENGISSSVSAPLQGFEGNNFTAGLPFLTTTFVVSKPPYQTAAGWKMVVDGVELTKVQSQQGGNL